MRKGKRFIAALLATSVASMAQQPGGQPATGTRDLVVTVGKSVLVDSPAVIERVSVANPNIAEAIVITPREVLVNGKAAGETSMIMWQQGGNRLIFDLTVRRNETRIDAIRREISREMGNDDVSLEMEGDNVFVRGTVADLTAADRAMAIAQTLSAAGRTPVNLLRVAVPGPETQILLQVRFANVDRGATDQLGVNFFSTGLGNTVGGVTTGQFSPPGLTGTGGSVSLTDALNVFLFRPDLNLGMTLRNLQSRRLLEILAEPNVLTMNGRPAQFLAGGEFPFPTLQGGGGGLGAVTIQFREFGVRINATPVVTPRGTIRMSVIPEVSSLDFANGLTFQGFNIPALSTRRVQTEIELESGQSFAIGGLLDNRVIENLNKVPGLGDIPFFGKLFRSRDFLRNNTELLVIVTPEIVRPIAQAAQVPQINFPKPMMEPNTSAAAPRTPGVGVTGMVPVKPPKATIPVETLVQSQKAPESGQTTQQPLQFVPVPMITGPQQTTQPPVAPVKPPSPGGGSGQ